MHCCWVELVGVSETCVVMSVRVSCCEVLWSELELVPTAIACEEADFSVLFKVSDLSVLFKVSDLSVLFKVSELDVVCCGECVGAVRLVEDEER